MQAKILLVLGLSMLLAISMAHPIAAQMPGGWSKASVKDQQVIQAAKFALNAQQKAIKDAGGTEKLTLLKIVAAQQQVVAGMNYQLTLKVKHGDKVRTAEARVWWQAAAKSPTSSPRGSSPRRRTPRPSAKPSDAWSTGARPRTDRNAHKSLLLSPGESIGVALSPFAPRKCVPSAKRKATLVSSPASSPDRDDR